MDSESFEIDATRPIPWKVDDDGLATHAAQAVSAVSLANSAHPGLGLVAGMAFGQAKRWKDEVVDAITRRPTTGEFVPDEPFRGFFIPNDPAKGEVKYVVQRLDKATRTRQPTVTVRYGSGGLMKPWRSMEESVYRWAASAGLRIRWEVGYAGVSNDRYIDLTFFVPGVADPSPPVASPSPAATRPPERVARSLADKAKRVGKSLADTATADIPDQIRKLAELRDSGILTEAEFEAKKSELLKRL